MRLDDGQRVTAAGDSQAAPDRLLQAAERLFAEHGFAGTSVRDITAAAGCNIAAVNYHFGSKEKLYRELFSMRLDQLREQRLAAVATVLEDAEREQNVTRVVEAFARAFVQPLTDPQRGRWVMAMFLREMTDPQLDRQVLAKKLFEPVQAVMCDALMRCVRDLHERQAVLCVHSLVAQLLHAVQVGRLFGGEVKEGAAAVVLDTEQVVAHVVSFTVAGIEALRKPQGTRVLPGPNGRKRGKG